MDQQSTQKSVIVFEDNECDVIFLENAFSKLAQTYQLIHVTSYDELLSQVSKIGMTCLLLDLKMPQIDGFEVLERIKTDEKLRSMPVIVFSSSENQDDVNLAYKLGANAFSVKPSTIKGYEMFVSRFTQFWLEAAQAPS